MLAFKNNAPFKSFISKTNSTLINNAEDLDIVMPMYNLLEYSQNYSMTSGSLWNYYRDDKQQKNLEMKEMQINHQYQLYTLQPLFQSCILVLFGDLLIFHL